jgi:hypothetical protein
MVNESEICIVIGQSLNVGISKKILSNADVVHPGGVQAEVVSTSTEDSSAGTGIQKVLIQYFNSSWEYKIEIVTTNGTTPVSTTETNIYRIESFRAIQVGSNGTAVGPVVIRSIGGANLFAQIDIGDTSFKRALHYIRRGWRSQLQSVIVCTSTSGGILFEPRATTDYTLFGGGYVLESFVPSILHDDILIVSGDNIPLVDATNSARALAVCMCVEGVVTGQEADVYFLFGEYHVKDV